MVPSPLVRAASRSVRSASAAGRWRFAPSCRRARPREWPTSPIQCRPVRDGSPPVRGDGETIAVCLEHTRAVRVTPRATRYTARAGGVAGAEIGVTTGGRDGRPEDVRAAIEVARARVQPPAAARGFRVSPDSPSPPSGNIPRGPRSVRGLRSREPPSSRCALSRTGRSRGTHLGRAGADLQGARRFVTKHGRALGSLEFCLTRDRETKTGIGGRQPTRERGRTSGRHRAG
jgi:hypothetical protein